MSATTPHPESIDDSVEALEQRVHRLEEAVAALGDTQLMEDRVVERVARRVEPQANGGLLSRAARAFSGTGPYPTDSAQPHDAVNEPADVSAPAPKSGWLIVEFFRELRTALRMFADYRYRMSWTGRVVPLACILVGVFSWLLVSGLPLVGGITDRLIDVILVIVLYKAMSREVHRYHSGAGRILR